MSQRKPEPDRYDPTQPPYEAYKIDFELFRMLISPCINLCIHLLIPIFLTIIVK